MDTLRQQREYATLEELLEAQYQFGPDRIEGESVGMSAYPLPFVDNCSAYTLQRQRCTTGCVFLYAEYIATKRFRRSILLELLVYLPGIKHFCSFCCFGFCCVIVSPLKPEVPVNTIQKFSSNLPQHTAFISKHQTVNVVTRRDLCLS
jgi:hypothetical protein